jgi:D-tyrosyl-tRNA(Tyr) deacylase
VIALLQRVAEARVTVREGEREVVVGEVGAGLLALVAVERGDDEAVVERLVERLLDYRMFPDDAGRMNLSLRATGGGLLLVSQFTLAADTDKGLRPSFTPAAPPAEGERLFERLVALARERHAPVATGRFGAQMRVALVNDGPVTFRLRMPPP